MKVIPKTSFNTHLQNLMTLLEEGRQDTLFAYVAELQRRMSCLPDGNQRKQWWCDLIKKVVEPAFMKFVLVPHGIHVEKNPNLWGLDFIESDLKFQTAPFFTKSPRYTYTINDGDIQTYADSVIVYLQHYRVQGEIWKIHQRDTEYLGPSMNLVCRPTMGEIKAQIKSRRISKEAYLERFWDESGNEPYRYSLDIRWFPLWLRRENNDWVSSAWTPEEQGFGQVVEELD